MCTCNVMDTFCSTTCMRFLDPRPPAANAAQITRHNRAGSNEGRDRLANALDKARRWRSEAASGEGAGEPLDGDAAKEVVGALADTGTKADLAGVDADAAQEALRTAPGAATDGPDSLRHSRQLCAVSDGAK